MTEDAAIRIDFDSAEFVHVTHIMEFLLHPAPRYLSHRILGTRTAGVDYDISNETRLPRYLPTYSPTHGLGYPCGWVSTLPPSTTQPPCGNLSHWDHRVNTMDV